MTPAQPLYIEIGSGLYQLVGLPTISTWDNKTRPKNARTGTLGFNFQTKSLEYWNGTDWYAAKML